MVGTDIYEKLIKGYTEKQWGRDCTELPSFIIKRLPLRFVYDNNYFNDRYQGNAVVNYTDREMPYTRIIEHKHFEFGTQPKTAISREYFSEWKPGIEPYYPINDEKNGSLFEQYRALAEKEENIIFGGRLRNYKYYDMDKVIEATLECVEKELSDCA